MIIKALSAPLKENLLETALLTVIFLFLYLIAVLFVKFRVKMVRRKEKVRTRLKYLFLIIFFMLLVQIWIDKFFQILAFIGFLSAAVTITQRDNITNFIAWFIINWRELFLEGDTVQVGKITGRVKSIGPLYITIHETYEAQPAYSTGRTIKLPNGMVSKNPVINFSTQHRLTHRVEYLFDSKANLSQLKAYAEQLVFELKEYYKSIGEKTQLEGCHFNFNLQQSKMSGLLFTLQFQSGLEELLLLKQFLDEKLLATHNSDSEIKLVME